MTPEERFELHEQWLRSLESNQAQFAENLGRMEGHLANYQKVFAEHMVTVAMNQAAFAAALARHTEEMGELRELVERYIRHRGNGNQPAN